MRSVSHSVTEELEERSEYGRVASSLASIGSSTTDGCVIKAKASFATKDVYDQCDKTMARADAVIPPISGNCVPLCYVDGKCPLTFATLEVRFLPFLHLQKSTPISSPSIAFAPL